MRQANGAADSVRGRWWRPPRIEAWWRRNCSRRPGRSSPRSPRLALPQPPRAPSRCACPTLPLALLACPIGFSNQTAPMLHVMAPAWCACYAAHCARPRLLFTCRLRERLVMDRGNARCCILGEPISSSMCHLASVALPHSWHACMTVAMLVSSPRLPVAGHISGKSD